MVRVGVVKDIDLGWEQIEREIQKAEKSFVLVGFQEGEKTKKQQKGSRTKKSGLSLAEIAASNEFGTRSIPARPFMRTSFDENLPKINQAIRSQYVKILDGKSTTKKSLGLIGLLMVSLIQEKIRAIHSPPNSARTIAIKKSSKPLIDFGQMIQSVREKVVLN